MNQPSHPPVRYHVYVNDVHKKAVGHIEPCGAIHLWGGGIRATGGWLGAYGSPGDAKAVGEASGYQFHWCGLCRRWRVDRKQEVKNG